VRIIHKFLVWALKPTCRSGSVEEWHFREETGAINVVLAAASMRSGWLALAAGWRRGVPFVVQIHAEIWLEVRKSVHVLPRSVRFVVARRSSEVRLLPVVVLELVLVVVKRAMVMVDHGPVMELRELLDVV